MRASQPSRPDDPSAERAFARLVSLACHDLRSPLATVYGFARTLTRDGELDERSGRFVGMIEKASEQMTELLDALAVAARIEGERWEPALREVDTAELADDDDERIAAEGTGTPVETEPREVARALHALAVAALRHGGVERVAWAVDGRTLVLRPIEEAAVPILTGEDPRDLGALVARIVLERLGGTLALDAGALRVTL
jgi:signal transduction histidine kinase